MNTSTESAAVAQPSTAVNSASITEADVVAFLVARAAELSAATGENYCLVKVEVLNACHGNGPEIRFCSYVNGDIHRDSRDSLAEAMAMSVRSMSPTIRASELREKAQAMIAEANKLTPAA